MPFPEVVSRERWLEARLRLLDEEKKETRRRDVLNAERRRQRRPVRPRCPATAVSCAMATRSSTPIDLWAGQRVHPSLYTLLDLTALGRQEAWEEPTGRVPVLHET